MRFSNILIVGILSIQSLFAADIKAQTLDSFRIGLQGENYTLADFIQEIETKTDFRFSYFENEIDLSTNILVATEEQDLRTLLEEVSRSAKIKFYRVNNMISISEIDIRIPTKVEVVEQISVSGIVTDGEGVPLPGTSVNIKGTSSGVTTDFDGRYSIDVDQGEVLQFSYLGFDTQEISVGDQTQIDVVMTYNTSELDAVVVVGYGSLDRKDVTGSVASINSEDIADRPITNVQQALKGQAAGVVVTQNTGSPSSGLTIRIRGNSSITAGNDPLYVIDGVPISGGGSGMANIPGGGNPMNSISPNDIESIDILKDASATAIYGSRGANGVVLITTKSGKKGESSLSLNTYTGFQQVAKKLKPLNPEEFAAYHIESRENGFLLSGGDPNTPNEDRGRFRVADIYFNPDQWQRTDWQDEIFRTGMVQNVNLNAAGGTEKTTYYVSGDYFKHEGIIMESQLERFSLRANVESEVNDWLKVGMRVTPSHTINNQQETEGHFRGALVGMALRQTPVIGPYNEDGSYTNPLSLRNNTTGIGTLGAVDNPVTMAKENEFELIQNRVVANTYLDFDLAKGLKFRTSLGIDFIQNTSRSFYSSLTGRRGSTPPSVPSGTAIQSTKLNWLNENLLTYDARFGQHKINAIAGYSAQKDDYRAVRLDGDQFPNDNVPYGSAAGVIVGGNERRNQWALISYFGRVNYSFDDKYLLTGTIRRDGSSRFGQNNRYGTFPSGSFAWRASNEEFLRDSR